MTRIHAIILAAVGGVGLGLGLSASARAGEYPLTLEDATTRALSKNERVAIERHAVQAARAGVSGANGAYDPVLAFEGGWRENDGPTGATLRGESTSGVLALRQLLPTGGRLSFQSTALRATNDGTLSAFGSRTYQGTLGAELRQPLLRDRATDRARLDRRVASSSRDAADASLRQAVIETVAGVEDAYWTVVSSRQAVGVREEAVRLAEEQLRETETRVESGAAPETEVAEPRAELETRRGALLAAREAASRAESALKFLILGEDDPLWLDALVPVSDVALPAETPDVEAAMKRALELRPELARAEADVKARKAGTSYAKNQVSPSLDAVASYSRYGLAGDGLGGAFDDIGSGDLHDARVGVAFELPLGNRAARAGSREAQSAQRQAESERARVRKQIRVEVLNAAAGVETAAARIEAARAAREAAEVQFEAERNRFEAGMSTNFLVLTRQNDLSRARLDEIAARTDYRRARIEMARATGSLAADRGIDVNDETH